MKRYIPLYIRQILLVTCVFLLSYNGYARVYPEFLVHKTFYERADTMMKMRDRLTKTKDFSKTMEELISFSDWAEKQDEELAYHFKLIRYEASYIINRRKDPELERAFSELIKDVEKKEYKLLALHARSGFGSYYWASTKEYGKAFEQLLQNYNIYTGMSGEDCPFKYRYLFDLGMKYYVFKDYINAKRLFLEADRTKFKTKDPGILSQLNALGLSYRSLGMYDSALYYFNIGLKQADDDHKLTHDAILSGNIGITYYYQGKYDEAIPLLEKDIDYGMRHRVVDNATKSMAVLANIYYNKGEQERALKLLDSCRAVISRRGWWNRYEILELVYPVVAKVYAAQGNKGLAYDYMDSAAKVKDSLAIQKSALILSGAQSIAEAQKHMADLQELNDQRRFQVFIRNSLMIVVVLLGALALLFINRQKLSHRRKEEKLESEKLLVDMELSNATEQLKMFTQRIREKNQLIEKVGSELEARQADSEQNADLNEEMLDQLRESTILTDEQWEDFRKMFEKVHAGYLRRLNEKIPGVTPAEMRFFTLSKLKLSNKEMAGMLGISLGAVRMGKHRIRKKLNLPEDADIEELVDAM